MALNKVINLDYDKKADVLYGSFGFTNEPSYCDDLNDFTLIELGMFTNLPTGFRIINISKHSIKESLQLIIGYLRKIREELVKQNVQEEKEIQKELKDEKIMELLSI